MKTFAINTLGCKVNQYESQQIRELLENSGLFQSRPTGSSPDLIVINTCCVTHNASAKSRQYIRKAQKQHPNASIVVTGCLPAAETGELKAFNKNIYLIRQRNKLKDVLYKLLTSCSVYQSAAEFQPQISSEYIKAENTSKIKHKNNLFDLEPLSLFKGQTRAFLKIQDGCDGYCSYCIIPKTRPNVHSKQPDAVFEEAKALVVGGHKEIVVTGVFLGAYGHSTVRRNRWAGGKNDKLAELLDKLSGVPGLSRIRLSSLAPGDVSDRLIETIANNPNIMPHLHLSLQSGSDRILKKMCRQYTIEEFLKTAAKIKSRLERPAITTDIIVGFPGESEDDFQKTLEVVQKVRFSRIHVFSFSARKGTAAARMPAFVNKEVIKERSVILREKGAKLAREFREQFVGREVNVLLEHSDGQACGRSERYFQVSISNDEGRFKRNDLVRVKITENGDNEAVGEDLELIEP